MHFQRRLKDLYFTLFPFSCGESSSSKFLVFGWKIPTSYMLTDHYCWSSFPDMMSGSDQHLDVLRWKPLWLVKLKDWRVSTWHCGQKRVRRCYKIFTWKIYFYLTLIGLHHQIFHCEFCGDLALLQTRQQAESKFCFWKRYLRLLIQECAKNSL